MNPTKNTDKGKIVRQKTRLKHKRERDIWTQEKTRFLRSTQGKRKKNNRRKERKTVSKTDVKKETQKGKQTLRKKDKMTM